jgi:cytochrome oxidase Cu insertion factor (SCO1/SenC/PrrC family)
MNPTTPKRKGSTGAANSRIFFILGLLAALIAGGAGGWLLGRGYRAGHGVEQLPLLGRAPQYRLTNQLGQTVSSSQFRGKVQIVTFLFPYCTTYCPIIAAHLVGLEHTLVRAGMKHKVQLVAFDVDPAGTGPVQMSAFMKEYGWDPNDLRWQYLTGKPAEIRRVVTGGFHVSYQKVRNSAEPGTADDDTGTALAPQPTVVNTLAERDKPGYDITHNDALEIVDQHGMIRKIYDDADVVSNQRLVRVVRALLPQAGESE